jgi:hypothetical protein
MNGHSSIATSNIVIYLYINKNLTVSMSTIAKQCISTSMHVASGTVRETLSVVHFEDVANTGILSSCDTLSATERDLFVINNVMLLVKQGMLFFVENFFALPFLEIVPYSKPHTFERFIFITLQLILNFYMTTTNKTGKWLPIK